MSAFQTLRLGMQTWGFLYLRRYLKPRPHTGFGLAGSLGIFFLARLVLLPVRSGIISHMKWRSA